jgi:4-hydroxy-4-methyl-2-oxoglutarate aldolase
MPPIVGYASTATMRTANPRAEGAVYGSLDEQIAHFGELPGPAIVVFQDLDDPAVGATFGEVMCASYQSFGAVGIITSGPARDLDQVRRRGFAAFSNGVVSSHSYSHITSPTGAGGWHRGAAGPPAARRRQRGVRHSVGDCFGGSARRRRVRGRRILRDAVCR